MSIREDIRQLHIQGLTYDRIAEQVGCSKSTVCYHLDPSQREKRAGRQRDRRNYNRRYLEDIKDRTPCADCGIDYPAYVMDFDHVRGSKLGNVSQIAATGTLEEVKAEIEKCEVVCANCHRQRTYDRLRKTNS